MQKLKRAIETIRTAQDRLNVGYENCGECGMRHYDNLDEHRANDALDGAATRIQRAINLITDNNSEPSAPKEIHHGKKSTNPRH